MARDPRTPTRSPSGSSLPSSDGRASAPPRLNVASVVDRTEAEGPGSRFAVWVQGCPMRCAGCCNPDLLAFAPREDVDPRALAERALRAGVEGVSLLGGEPFAQAEALAVFARLARAGGLSVMIYSGYALEEIPALPGPGPAELLAEADLLVDGRYEKARRTTARRWIGSENQRLHFLPGRYAPDDLRFAAPNTLEIRVADDGTISLNGWPTAGAATGLRIFGDAR